jgi:predicted molibdopterin-dependent oxidoreductase YjgC
VGAAWNVEPGGLSRKRGLTTTEILSHAHPGGVRALYIMGENPMMTEPNLNQTRQHMQQLEFLVAQDLFINESGAFADVFLPAAPGRRRTAPSPTPTGACSACARQFQPRGQARPDWQIICDLAQRIEARLGRPNSAGWDYAIQSRSFGEMAASWRVCWASPTSASRGGLAVPGWDENHPGTPFLFAESFPIAGAGVSTRSSTSRSPSRRTTSIPFILTTGRVLEHWHGGTMTRHSQLDALYPEAYLEVHEMDAAQLGRLKDGDAVRVASRRGLAGGGRAAHEAAAKLAQGDAGGGLYADALRRGRRQPADHRRPGPARSQDPGVQSLRGLDRNRKIDRYVW